MRHEHVPEDISTFITLYIDSIELLWVLLLLHEQPERVWSVADIEKELRSSSSAIKKRLEDLYSRKIMLQAEANGHRYQPATPELARMIERVAKYHASHSSRVIELIFARADESLKNFAAAFKLKKDK